MGNCPSEGTEMRQVPEWNQGNFKELIKFRIEAGETVLGGHLNKCSSYAAYTSKTSQNELLYCIMTSIQKHIVGETKINILV